MRQFILFPQLARMRECDLLVWQVTAWSVVSGGTFTIGKILFPYSICAAGTGCQCNDAHSEEQSLTSDL